MTINASLRFLVKYPITPSWNTLLLGGIVDIRVVVIFVRGVKIKFSFLESVKDGVVLFNLKKLVF